MPQYEKAFHCVLQPFFWTHIMTPAPNHQAFFIVYLLLFRMLLLNSFNWKKNLSWTVIQWELFLFWLLRHFVKFVIWESVGYGDTGLFFLTVLPLKSKYIIMLIGYYLWFLDAPHPKTTYFFPFTLVFFNP